MHKIVGNRKWRNRKHRVYTKYLLSAYPLIIEHYKLLRNGLKKINKKYGTDITVELASSFKKSMKKWKKERNKL